MLGVYHELGVGASKTQPGLILTGTADIGAVIASALQMRKRSYRENKSICPRSRQVLGQHERGRV